MTSLITASEFVAIIRRDDDAIKRKALRRLGVTAILLAVALVALFMSRSVHSLVAALATLGFFWYVLAQTRATVAEHRKRWSSCGPSGIPTDIINSSMIQCRTKYAELFEHLSNEELKKLFTYRVDEDGVAHLSIDISRMVVIPERLPQDPALMAERDDWMVN